MSMPGGGYTAALWVGDVTTPFGRVGSAVMFAAFMHVCAPGGERFGSCPVGQTY